MQPDAPTTAAEAIKMLCLMTCSGADMERYGIKTILDLKRMDRPCKKKGKKIDQLRLAGRYIQKVRPGAADDCNNEHL